MKWDGKKILITGGAGFIGSHLADKLIELGAEVTVVDINKKNLKNLNDVKNHVNFIECDITNPDNLKKIRDNIEYIFHLAALANPRECEKNIELAFKINVIGTLNVLNFAKQKNVKKVIFTSSAQLYGGDPKVPTDENHPIKPEESIYSSTKRMGEELCILFNEKHNIPTIFLRLFNTFGPRQSVDYFVPTVISQALNKGFVELWSDKPTRDFVFVKDTVTALIKAAETDFRGGPINIGCGREINVGDLGKKIASDLNVEIKFLNKEIIGPNRLLCNNNMAQKVLKWEPEVKFEDGLKLTIEWFKKKN